MKLLHFPTPPATSALLFWIAAGTLSLSLVIVPVAQAQPVTAPEAPAPATRADIEGTVAALVEATQSDEGYLSAQEVVAGVSKAGILAQAWREWRVAALGASTGTLQTRLLLQDVEVEEFKRQRDAGGFASSAATARVKVHLAIASGPPSQPVEQWPADPWQGEFTLTRANAEDALWQFDFPMEEAVQEEAVGEDGTLPDEGAIIEVSERGGNRLEQAVQVLRHPAAMLRTTLLRVDKGSLALLVTAVTRYTSKTGHYPPADYAAALLENEPQETQPALRAAFAVAGTTRTWQLNPALTGQPVPPPAPLEPPLVPEEASEGVNRGGPEAEEPPTEGPPAEVPLFWDGSAEQPLFRFAGQALVALTNGQVELRRAQDLQAGSPRQAVSPRKE